MPCQRIDQPWRTQGLKVFVQDGSVPFFPMVGVLGVAQARATGMLAIGCGTSSGTAEGAMCSKLAPKVPILEYG